MIERYIHETVSYGDRKPVVVTYCRLIDEEREIILAEGVAICSPKDQYNRKKGNLIANGRAYKALEEKKDNRQVRESLMELTGVSYKSVYLGAHPEIIQYPKQSI